MVKVPPQTVLVPLATVRPVGKVSANATPDNATVFAAGLVIVNISDVVAFSEIADGLNALAIDGGATTARIAVLLAAPVPPSVDVTADVVLAKLPAAVPVTFTENVQEALAASVPPLRLTPVFWVAVMVPPPQLPVRPLGVEIIKPAGRVSLKATPLSVVLVLGLLIVKLRLVEPFCGMLAAPNAFVIVGGPTTVTLAVEVVLVPPSVELACTELFFTPTVVPVTLTETVQFPLAASVAPVRLTEPPPAVASAVPPQVLLSPLGVATTKPAGKLSVNTIPVRLRPVFGFVILNVSEVVPFNGTLAAPNALMIDGGEATVRFALAVFPVPPFVDVTLPVVLVYCPEAAPVTVTLN